MLIKSKFSGWLADGTRTPFISLGGGSPPAPPDYTGAAKETAAGNLEATRAATRANRVNQVTPYGNLTYTQSSKPVFNEQAYKIATDAYNTAMQSYQPTTTDEYGNVVQNNTAAPLAPKYEDFLSKVDPDSGWTATQTLTPEQQKILDMQTQASLGLGTSINAQLKQVQDVMGKGFNPNTPAIQYGSKSPTLQTGLDYQGMEGWDKATALLNQRLQPQIEQSNEKLQAQLANQGIAPGTEAYNRAMMQQGQKTNDLLTQAQLAGQNVQQNMFGQALQGGQFSNTAQQQMFANQQASANLSNTAQQQAYNQALTQYNLPLNTLSALRTGAQIQNPSFVNPAQQATTSGPDILGATQMGYNAQMGGYNAEQAAQNNMTQGMFSLGGAGIMKYSDIRMKENIKQIHWSLNGLPVYEYEYKPEFKDIAGHGKHIGVMAQEVEIVQPEAVITNANGYKMVNYGLLS
jgi:hypothetical protein